MKKLRLVLIIIACLLIIVALFYTDFSDLSWSNNSGNYIGIISMIFLIIAMIGSNRNDRKSDR